MINYRSLFITISLVANNLSAQVNLVPNGSFEDTLTCPTNTTQISYSPPWYMPTQGTPDYFNECSNSIVGIPSNGFGFHWARTGNAYSGITVFAPIVSYREYLSIKLTDSLIIGKNYCVDFYVCLAGKSKYACANIGMYLSHDSVADNSTSYNLNLTPQIYNAAGNIISDTINWTHISGQFMATNSEKYITIGNFYSNPTSDTSLLTTGIQNNAYYYIDDVSIIDCDSLIGIDSPAFSALTLFPNPSSGNFLLSGNFPSNSQLHLYNLLGQEVTDPISLSEGNQKISIALNLAEGIYVYRIISAGEILHEEKLVIVK